MSVTSTPMRFDAPEITLACATTSGGTAFALPKQGQTVELKNFGAVEAYVAIGTSTVTASTTDVLIPTNMSLLYLIDPTHTHIAGVTSASTTNIRVKVGEGI